MLNSSTDPFARIAPDAQQDPTAGSPSDGQRLQPRILQESLSATFLTGRRSQAYCCSIVAVVFLLSSKGGGTGLNSASQCLPASANRRQLLTRAPQSPALLVSFRSTAIGIRRMIFRPWRGASDTRISRAQTALTGLRFQDPSRGTEAHLLHLPLRHRRHDRRSHFSATDHQVGAQWLYHGASKSCAEKTAVAHIAKHARTGAGRVRSLQVEGLLHARRGACALITPFSTARNTNIYICTSCNSCATSSRFTKTSRARHTTFSAVVATSASTPTTMTMKKTMRTRRPTAKTRLSGSCRRRSSKTRTPYARSALLAVSPVASAHPDERSCR